MNNSPSSEFNSQSYDRREETREQLKREANHLRQSTHRSEFVQSIRSLFQKLKAENPSDHLKRILDEGTWDEIKNEALEIRRNMEIDGKLKRISSQTINRGITFFNIIQSLLDQKKVVDRLQNDLKRYQKSDQRESLHPEEATALRSLIIQLRQSLQIYHPLREQAFALFYRYSQNRQKEMGEEAALRLSMDFYLQFLDTPQRAKIEIQIKEKMEDMPLERRIDALKVFIQTLVQFSPSIREAERERCIEMARHLQEEHDFDDAIQELQKALEYAECPRVYLLLADCWKDKGNRAEEIMALQKILDFQPDSIEALTRLARIDEENSNLPSAIAYYERILKYRPERLSILSHIAHLSYEAQQWPEAIQWLSRLLQKKPRSKKTLMRLGIALIWNGHYDRGRAMLSECRRRGMEDATIDLHLGIAYRNQGFHDDALHSIQTAFQQLPNDPKVLYWVTLCHYECGEYEKADELLHSLLSKSETKSESTPEILLLHAKILYSLGKYQDVLDLIQPHLEKYREQLGLLLEYGKSCLKVNQAEEAYQILKPLWNPPMGEKPWINSDPHNQEIRELISQACIQSGRFTESFEYMIP